mgnify:CR=1 FL=1
MKYDKVKFRKLVHYICNSIEADFLGATKLDKSLWFADVLAYLHLEKPITGETYIKRQFGPVPYHILPAVDELVKAGMIVVKEKPFYVGTKREFISLTEPDVSVFSPQEMALIDYAVNYVCKENTARSISAKSHNRIWELAEIGEEIPYHAIWATQLGEIDEHDIAWAKNCLKAMVAA